MMEHLKTGFVHSILFLTHFTKNFWFGSSLPYVRKFFNGEVWKVLKTASTWLNTLSNPQKRNTSWNAPNINFPTKGSFTCFAIFMYFKWSQNRCCVPLYFILLTIKSLKATKLKKKKKISMDSKRNNKILREPKLEVLFRHKFTILIQPLPTNKLGYTRVKKSSSSEYIKKRKL